MLPLNHPIDDETFAFVLEQLEQLDEFLTS